MSANNWLNTFNPKNMQPFFLLIFIFIPTFSMFEVCIILIISGKFREGCLYRIDKEIEVDHWINIVDQLMTTV